jgi:hypothetical protein
MGVSMPDPAPVEYLWRIDRCRGSLDCFAAYSDRRPTALEHWDGHLVRYRIVRRTPKRVYYEDHGRTRFLNRQTLETTGQDGTGRPWYDGYLYAEKPPMPETESSHA